jgi:ATP-dependent exoDNAse (exonuclease V) beta subunit
VLENGQVVRGRIDLLLNTKDGWVVVDHKSAPLAEDRWHNLAAEHAGQLYAYGRGVEAVTGRKVIEYWLFLPVAGGAVRV